VTGGGIELSGIEQTGTHVPETASPGRRHGAGTLCGVHLLSNIRYAARGFARTPGLSIALVLTIALGVGANASVYAFVRGLLARDTPLSAVDRLVSIVARDAQRAAGPLSHEHYLRLQDRGDVFEWIGAARDLQVSIAQNGQSATLSATSITPDLARLLNLALQDGVVISYRAWRNEFRSSKTVRGMPIEIDGVDERIGDIAPEWLDGLYAGREVDVWMRLADDSGEQGNRASRTLWAIGRLRDGISTDAAEAALNTTADGVARTGVVRYTGMTPDVADGVARVGALLAFASAGVFLMACANVASFLLGRASTRSRETSTRVALGATRGQLAAQLLLDSALISLAGAACGVLLAVWTTDIIPALFFEEDAERLVFAPDGLGLVAASVGCAALTIVCGLAPFFEIRHDRPAAVLQRESAGPSPAMRRLRTLLVVAQMTCCCVLLISAGLLVQSLRTAVQTNAAHRLGQPILATVQAGRGLPADGYRYFEQVERAAQSVPGASSAAWTSALPGSRPVWQSLRVEPVRLPVREVTIDTVTFTPEMLPRLVLPPIAGRMFGGGDTVGSCRVAVANEEAARLLFDTDPIGRSITDASGAPAVIIGVVRMRKSEGGDPAPPTIYYYANQQRPPLEPGGPTKFRAPAAPPLLRAAFDTTIVSPGYLDVMGVTTAAGRTSPEHRANRACSVAVVNEEAAEQYFGGDAVGAAVIDRLGRRTEIVGVVRSERLQTFQRRVEPAIYFPMADHYMPRMTLVLGAQNADDRMVEAVRRAVNGVPGNGALPSVKTLEAHLNRTALAPLRIAAALVGAFAATALALGILGLYGALSDAIRQRRPEIAMRIALGAPAWRLVRQVSGEGARFAAAGAVAGLLGSILVSRSLTRITLVDTPPAIGVWMAAPLVLLGAAAIASILPALRAVRIDPLTIMRRET
jgi:predicted permease